MTRHAKTIRMLLCLCAPAMSLFAAGCSTNPVTGKWELSLIPAAQEIAIGREAAPKFEAEFGGRVANEQLQQYVREIGQKVATVSDRPMPYDYTLLGSGVPNAFALPGGKIYITAGLLCRMTNERQLAAVLGHETGHVAAKHSVKGMQRQMGANMLVEVARRLANPKNAAVAGDVAKVVTAMGNLKYSRLDEYQADEVGIKYMTLAGYNPHGMVELLTILKNLSDAEPGVFAEMFQTHPLSSKRILEAEEIINSNEDYRGFPASAPDPNAGRFMTMRSLLTPAAGANKNK